MGADPCTNEKPSHVFGAYEAVMRRITALVLSAMLTGASFTFAFPPPTIHVTAASAKALGISVVIKRVEYNPKQLAVSISVPEGLETPDELKAALTSDDLYIDLVLTPQGGDAWTINFLMTPQLLNEAYVCLFYAEGQTSKKIYKIPFVLFMPSDDRDNAPRTSY